VVNDRDKEGVVEEEDVAEGGGSRPGTALDTGAGAGACRRGGGDMTEGDRDKDSGVDSGEGEDCCDRVRDDGMELKRIEPGPELEVWVREAGPHVLPTLMVRFAVGGGGVYTMAAAAASAWGRMIEARLLRAHVAAASDTMKFCRRLRCMSIQTRSFAACATSKGAVVTCVLRPSNGNKVPSKILQACSRSNVRSLILDSWALAVTRD